MTFKEYAEVSNKFSKSYYAKKSTSYTIYLDANNLYKHSTLKLFLTQIPDRANPKDFSLNNYSKDNSLGCFIKIDFNYHDEFYVLHYDYLLAGEKIKAKKEILSNYQLQIIEYNKSSLGKNEKRISNLSN